MNNFQYFLDFFKKKILFLQAFIKLIPSPYAPLKQCPLKRP